MKKVSFLFLTLFCFATFCACGSTTSSSENINVPKEAPPAKTIAQKNDSLTVWFFEGSSANAKKQSIIYKSAIDMFQSQNPTIKINLDTVFTDDEAEVNRANTEIMAGNGPDVLLGSMDFNALKGGIYEDMTPFMQDGSFDESMFLKGSIASGKFYNKQYLVPISFGTHVFVSSEQALAKIGVKDTLISVIDLSEKIVNSLKKGDIDKVFGHQNSYLFDFDRYLGTELINYEADTINISTAESKAYFENAKSIIDASWTYKDSNSENNYSNGAKKIANGEMLFIDVISPYELLSAAMAVNHNSSPVFMPVRNKQLEIIAYPMLQAGICSLSSNKQNAYNFIEVLLSEEFQCSDFLQDIQLVPTSPAGMPINLKAFEKRVKEPDYNKSVAIFQQEFQAGDFKELSSDQIDQYISLMNSGMDINFFRTDYYALSRELDKYIFENANLDSILSDFENKLKIKMNE